MNAKNTRSQGRYRIPENLLAQIELLAKSKGTSRNDIVCTAITEYVGKNTGNEAVFTKVMNKLSSSFQELTTTISDLSSKMNTYACDSKNNTDKLAYLCTGQDAQFFLELCILSYFYSSFHNEFNEHDMVDSYSFLNKFINEYHKFIDTKGNEYFQKLFSSRT